MTSTSAPPLIDPPSNSMAGNTTREKEYSQLSSPPPSTQHYSPPPPTLPGPLPLLAIPPGHHHPVLLRHPLAHPPFVLSYPPPRRTLSPCWSRTRTRPACRRRHAAARNLRKVPRRRRRCGGRAGRKRPRSKTAGGGIVARCGRGCRCWWRGRRRGRFGCGGGCSVEQEEGG